jgi:glycosyltransferase involved in cell wall biosynthesis
MRLFFVADGRSPIALNWIRFFVERGDEVHLASTFPGGSEAGLASYEVIPVAFSGLKRSQAETLRASQETPVPQTGRSLSGMLPPGLSTSIRQWLGPLTIPSAARHLANLVERVKPELVHAMRIPYEGMLAAQSGLSVPLVISVWGNDFTLHARSNPWMASFTRQALQHAAALHTDCQRDLRLAREWGFPSGLPSIVLPGNGGVQVTLFYPPDERPSSPVIINPRGFRAYLRSDTFFRSIPLVLARLPQARFLCPGMAGNPRAFRWVEEYGVAQAVDLLPFQSRQQMADLFRRAQVAVSPSTHDGTPNTLLEAMACGCFPVAGDIESLHEWITPGKNGLLIDPGDAAALAEAILQAFARPEMRERAEKINLNLITLQAEYTEVMQRAQEFYLDLLDK